MMCAGEGAGATANMRNAPVDKSNICTTPAESGVAPTKWERGKPREGAATSALLRRQTGKTADVVFLSHADRNATRLPAPGVGSRSGGFHSGPFPSSTALANKLSTSCLGMTAGAPAAE